MSGARTYAHTHTRTHAHAHTERQQQQHRHNIVVRERGKAHATQRASREAVPMRQEATARKGGGKTRRRHTPACRIHEQQNQIHSFALDPTGRGEWDILDAWRGGWDNERRRGGDEVSTIPT
eukprot:GHVU01070500.1.p1 GENE.GHVU01070500.1~~GHVU01070500.1.p1  ORF type:complete len:122 (+),score=21.87 GHVU01070500.1:143-508(+)